jgi:hypothetical protein
MADHFMIGVPFGRAVNPISKKELGRHGRVEPDVLVKGAEALEKAVDLAKSRLPQL